jgi:two-component system chemotaxis response regulator CheB
MNEKSVRVLVVDDTVTYRKIVSDVLTRLPGVEVVGTAANGRIALHKIEQLRPDLMTLDLEMPDMGGLEVLRQLRERQFDVGAVILSSFTREGADQTVAALENGAFDFVTKPDGQDVGGNANILEAELRRKIEAYSRQYQLRKLLRTGSPTRPPKPAPSAQPNNEALRRPLQAIKPFARQIEIVAIGISTGGPQALNCVLPQLPADLPAPVLIVQHMPPIFTKSLADDLNKRCALTVSEAADYEPVLSGNILIAPGGKQMKLVVEGGQKLIRLTDDPPEKSCRPSVDYLFRSVTRVCGANATGVIMTGMGNDGSLGCRQLKQRGAVIIAQDEASCVVFGMPREPIQEGIADIVAPLNDIASQIVQVVGKGVTTCK